MKSKIEEYVKNALNKKIVYSSTDLPSHTKDIVTERNKNFLSNYVDESLLHPIDDMVPAIYYNTVAIKRLQFLPEYLSCKNYKTKKHSSIIEEDSMLEPATACVVYAKPEDLHNIAKKLGPSCYHQLRNDGDVIINYNVNKINVYGELRDCNDIPLALFKEVNGKKCEYYAKKYKQIFEDLDFCAYPVMREINGKVCKCYELDYSYPKLYVKHNENPKFDFMKNIHTKIARQMLSDVNDFTNIWLLKANGAEVDFTESSPTIYTCDLSRDAVNYYNYKGYNLNFGITVSEAAKTLKDTTNSPKKVTEQKCM
ncbi:MAG: hypothetical protein IJZ26_01315 [Clostridia bacterium]|nr:hypothetical protein [Clostridia bacterium]